MDSKRSCCKEVSASKLCRRLPAALNNFHPAPESRPDFFFPKKNQIVNPPFKPSYP